MLRSIMLCIFVILAGLLLQTSCELILLKKGADVYCVSKNFQDKALAWTVGMDEKKEEKVQYNVTGEWSKWFPQDGEFPHLNCNPMQSEKCDGWTNLERWTKKIVTWTDVYGLVLDHRWNDLSLHIGLNNEPHVMELPSKNLQKFYVNLSVLSKTCVRLIFFNGETNPKDLGPSKNKYVIEIDCKNSTKALRILTMNRKSQSNSTNIAGSRESEYLNKGEYWTNFKIMYEMRENGLALWKINEELLPIPNTSSIKEFTHFAIRAELNTFYWIHHSDYTIVETNDISVPLEATIGPDNAKDRELCISITYHGQGNLTLLSDGRHIDSVILPNSDSWTTFRQIFYLEKTKTYKLSILPSIDTIGDARKFSFGSIRVCSGQEYKVAKHHQDESRSVRACGVLGNDTVIKTNLTKTTFPFVFPCEKGYFGANCDMKCSDIDGLSDCKSVIACNSALCTCLPGYHGDDCSQECGPNKHGISCASNCGKCDKGKQCFHASGSCPGNMCAAGFSGYYCNRPCIEGTYGKNCAQNCSQQCIKDDRHSACNTTNGSCTLGCKTDEYRPPTCHQKRATITEMKLIENGAESLEIEVNVDVDDVRLLKSYQVQVREHEQSTTDWINNKNESWTSNEKLIKLRVNDLKPKTKYEIRVLITERDNKYFDKNKRLNVTTLCKPASGKEAFKVTRHTNSIAIQLVYTPENDGYCKLPDYDYYLNDKKFENIIMHSDQVTLNIELQKSINEIDVKIKIQQKYNYKMYYEFNGKEETTGNEEGTKENIGPFIGVLLFFILVGVVLAFVFYRKRQFAKCNEMRIPVLFRRSIGDESGESSPAAIAALPVLPRGPLPAVPVPDVTPAANSTTHTCRVAVSNLQTYIEQAITSGLLRTQHALFPRGQTQPWDEGRKQEHRGKNRYGNLVAYDHTRVVLQPLPKHPHSHYINANYIDGYHAPKYYIATQGPKESTLNDFWRMIWQENVRVVVMLANLVEDGKIKCEKYWPNLGTKNQYGSITTRTVSEDEFMDHTIRELEVINAKQTRKVRQLHYTVWPDHGVPRYPHSLAKFLRLLNEVATPPMVVHCSAGVGRTGTVILAHACYKMAKSENAVDCLALVSKMRSQRPNMVDNKEQYEIAHHLLIELLVIGDTSISNEKFPSTLRKLNDHHALPRQYAILNEASAKDAGEVKETVSWPNERSRFPFIVPDTENRVLLDHEEGGSDFINAVHVDGVRCRGSYIATQLPLPNTRGHFWSMVFQHASAVLLLNRPDPSNDKSTVALWHDYDELKVTRTLRVKIKQQVTRPLFDIVTVELICDEMNKGTWKTGRRSVPVVVMKTWPTRNILPNSANELVQVWQEVDRLREKDLQVVVACYDGATACGLFLAAAHMFEEMEATQKVDVVNSVRCIRHSRSQFVSTFDQFRFLHDTVLSYLDLFDSYVNYSNF